MKSMNIAIIIATIFIITEQSMIAYNRSTDDSRPKHQGFGRIGTAIENTVTLHPGNAVNALATGDQADTTFGWHEDDDNSVKANRAQTYHNNNRHERRRNDRRHDRQAERYKETSRETHAERKRAHEERREEEIEINEERKSRRWFW